ncbi:MAG: Na+/H+ antiporter subunit B [Akkermansiaceae bacterium]
MNSVILATVSRLLTGLLLVFSVFLLLRGHNLPGGGFAGGLVAASAFVLYALASGFPAARRLLVFYPRVIMGFGLVLAIVAGLAGNVAGLPFLTGLWDKTPLPVIGKLGTPLLFDVGVFFAVLGVTTLIVFSLGEDTEEEG